MMKTKDFDSVMVTTPVTKITTGGKKIMLSKIRLPINSIIHFVPSSEITIGPTKDFFLLKNIDGTVQIYHVDETPIAIGNPTKNRTNLQAVLKVFKRNHLMFKTVTYLDRAISNNQNPIIINYGLVPRLYKYLNANINRYYEWVNGRYAIWYMVHQIGNRRNHFIYYQLPPTLPTKSELSRCMEKFTVTSMDVIYDPLAWNVLELWRLIHFKNEYMPDINEDVFEKTYIVFNEGPVATFINLGELLTFAEEKPDMAADMLYRFLNNMISLREPEEDEDLVAETVDSSVIMSPQNSPVVKKIQDYFVAGNITSGEQRYLTKLVNTASNAVDPKGGGLTLDKMVVSDSDIALESKVLIKDSPTIHDKSMRNSTLQNFSAQYITKVMHKHLVQTAMSFNDAGVIVKNIKTVDKVTAATKSTTYSVYLQPINGPATVWPFTVPQVEEDGTFYISGTKYRMDIQKGEMPIVKTKSDTVALTSYYGKIFVTRNSSTVNNFAKSFLKELYSNSLENGSVKNIVFGITNVAGYKLPRHYSAIAGDINSFQLTIQHGINSGKSFNMIFLPEKVNELYTDEQRAVLSANKLTPCGTGINSDTVVGMDNNGTIYEITTETHNIQILGTLPYLINESLGDGPIEYNEMSLMNVRLPIVMVFTYMFGLDETLNKLKIPFYVTSITTKLSYKPNQYVLKFNDAQYVIDVSERKHSTIIGGFNSIRKEIKHYRASNFNKQVSYTTLLSSLQIMGYHLREIKLIVDMFIDPITRKVLDITGYPNIDFYDMLLIANTLLLDDNIPKTNTVRYKGYERFSGFVYGQMINSLRQYRARGVTPSEGVNVNPKAVMMDVLQDETITIVEEINPIHSIKEMEGFTHSGKGGRQSITMVKETRGYEDSDHGVISQDTTDSTNVAIKAYFTPNAKLTNLLGIPETGKVGKDGISTFVSSAALLAPNADRDDAKRMAFGGIQMSHGVGCKDYSVLPYRTGYEDVIATRVGKKFAVTAKMNGVITSVKPGSKMVVKYDDDTLDHIELGILHGIVCGETIPHEIVTDLLPGEKVKAQDVLAFNIGFFERSILNPAAVSFKAGILARTAMVENPGTIEDGSVISENLARLLQTNVCQVYPIMVPFTSMIYNLVEIGDEITPDMILCTIDADVDGDMSGNKDAEGIKSLNLLSPNAPKAKSYGKVSNIEMFYYGDLEDINEGLKNIVLFYDNQRSKNIKSLNLKDALTGKIDESIRIAGKKLIEGHVGIKIYVDTVLAMGAGDKGTVGNMLKTTISRVATEEMISEDGQVIDANFGELATAARIVCSPLTGIVNTALIELSKEMFRLYKEG